MQPKIAGDIFGSVAQLIITRWSRVRVPPGLLWRNEMRNLLKKYMNHVGEIEGTLFLGQIVLGEFTDEEMVELRKIEEELKTENETKDDKSTDD